MGNFIRKYNHHITAALLFTFLLYIGDIYLFTHTHYYNGVKISHSHIYSGTQDVPNHSHTAQQLNIIHLLSTFSSDGYTFNPSSLISLSLVDVINQRVICSAGYLYTPNLSSRAPPVMA